MESNKFKNYKYVACGLLIGSAIIFNTLCGIAADYIEFIKEYDVRYGEFWQSMDDLNLIWLMILSAIMFLMSLILFSIETKE